MTYSGHRNNYMTNISEYLLLHPYLMLTSAVVFWVCISVLLNDNQVHTPFASSGRGSLFWD